MFSWRIILLVVYAWRFSDAALKIEPIYATFNVPELESATCTCTNLDVLGTQPEWVDPNGQVIGPSGGGGSDDKYVAFHTDPSTGYKVTRLHMDNIVKSWGGGYVCRADGETKTINIFIYMAVNLVYEEREKNQHMIYHEAGNLACTMTGETNTVVSWFGPMGPISNGGRYLITPMIGLVIDNVTLDDEGDYRCSGTVPNVGAAEVLKIDANVYIKPRIRYPPVNKNATEGTSAFFTCEAIGEPQPAYAWYDGALKLDDPAKYVLEDDNRRLTILNLEKTDQKRYSCVVENPAGEDRRDGELTVDIPPTPTRPAELEREERGSVKFFCDIQRGDQEHLVLQWKRYEKWLPMGVQGDSRIVIQEETGSGADAGSPGSISLSISQIHRGDEGPYTCFARNNGGYATADSILHVRYEPVINQDYTINKVFSWVGREVNLTCHWYGYPIPRVYWYVNSQPLVGAMGEFAGNATIYDFNNGSSTLYIETTERDFLPYQCKGKNRYGETIHRIQFNRAYVMRKPRNVKAISASATTIEVSFDDPIEVGSDYPEYLRILGYVIGYSEYQHASESYVIVQNQCSPGEFQCGRLCIEKTRRCDNFMDCLDNSDEENCNPDDQDCPDGFKCPIRDGSKNPCLPLSYVCDQHSDCVDGADETEQACNNYFRPIFFDTRLTSLAPDRLYQFRVAVINEVGWGEWSYNSSERTLDYGPPSEPMIFEREPERDTIYELVWLEPYDNGGSPIISYEITYSAVKSADATELGVDPVTVPSSKNSDSAPVFRHTLTNLLPGTFYFLELRAESTWGKSEPTIIIFRMPGGAPNPKVTDEPRAPGLQIGDLHIASFIGILVGGFLIILLLLDCICYCTNSCGLTMCICVHLCGKESPEAKEEMEAVEYGMSMSTVGDRMRMQRLAEVESESNFMLDGASQYTSLHNTHMPDDRWKMPTHASYAEDQLLHGTHMTDLASTMHPVYGDLNPSVVSGPPPSYRGFMYPPSEPIYANGSEPPLFDNTDPSYRSEKNALERDLKAIFT